mmetsp:Transcript_6996/g.20432  ORF Transcript_6996/g.20432 Transcript_6996/m.20432 type:complete len:394 (+) Transcript_6996:25-1206(+)
MGCCVSSGSRSLPLSRACSAASQPYWLTMVPMPSSVKSSRSALCGTRPSMMIAASTCERTASVAVCSLGTMPPLMVPSATSEDTSESESCVSSFMFLSSTPATSVRSIRRLACRAPAMAPAAVSAFTLLLLPFASTPTGATTGMTPSAERCRSRDTSTTSGSPTSPRSTWMGRPLSGSTTSFSAFLVRRMFPSFPLRPTALPPASWMALTMPLLMGPDNTISATSMVASSVTRRPSTNLDSMSSLVSMSLICGPPPCTMITLIPTALSSTMSLANCFARASSTMAWPPYFTTINSPAYRWMYGSDRARTSPVTAAPEMPLSLLEIARSCEAAIRVDAAGPRCTGRNAATSARPEAQSSPRSDILRIRRVRWQAPSSWQPRREKPAALPRMPWG